MILTVRKLARVWGGRRASQQYAHPAALPMAASLLAVLCLSLSLAAPAHAQQNFRELVGNVPIGNVGKNATVTVPYLTWGGDVATFQANGDLKTTPDSHFKKLGLDLQLVPGDNFVQQVKDYLAGKTPLLRGTLHMLGQASEVLGDDPRTKPVVILQLSWSAGDHIVARKELRNLNELKGKKIAVQQGGPHVGLLYDSLSAAQLTKNDVTIVWTKDLTGPQGAAELFRTDPSVDACCVITPDMLGLTGGFGSIGSGAEGTVAGAHVINSTQQMSRSIADVYAVRRDWYDANKPWVAKFVAGYLQGTNQTLALRKGFEETKRMAPEYQKLLALSQKIFGAEVLPTLEVDAHGLLLDCAFVGLPGQIAFFESQGNLSGFEPKMKEALDLGTQWGYARTRRGFDPGGLDYHEIAKLAGIPYEAPAATERFASGAEAITDFFGENLDANTIVSFTISFEPNQEEFSADRYGAEFERALRAASTFGNARVIIRGHSDPTKTLLDFIRSGIQKGLIKQTGTAPNYRYFYREQPLDLSNVKEVVKLIEQGSFGGGKDDPVVTMQAAMALSQARAVKVKDSLAAYAKSRGATVDLSQITPVGAGILEPVIAKPKSIQEAKENMRVEFRIVKIDPETIAPTDFNF
jgi:ABC-type nitrate/sulfonate/bicarbonate transport system substrate-binding protein